MEIYNKISEKTLKYMLCLGIEKAENKAEILAILKLYSELIERGIERKW